MSHNFHSYMLYRFAAAVALVEIESQAAVPPSDSDESPFSTGGGRFEQPVVLVANFQTTFDFSYMSLSLTFENLPQKSAVEHSLIL